MDRFSRDPVAVITATTVMSAQDSHAKPAPATGDEQPQHLVFLLPHGGLALGTASHAPALGCVQSFGSTAEPAAHTSSPPRWLYERVFVRLEGPFSGLTPYMPRTCHTDGTAIVVDGFGPGAIVECRQAHAARYELRMVFRPAGGGTAQVLQLRCLRQDHYQVLCDVGANFITPPRDASRAPTTGSSPVGRRLFSRRPCRALSSSRQAGAAQAVE